MLRNLRVSQYQPIGMEWYNEIKVVDKIAYWSDTYKTNQKLPEYETLTRIKIY